MHMHKKVCQGHHECRRRRKEVQLFAYGYETTEMGVQAKRPQVGKEARVRSTPQLHFFETGIWKDGFSSKSALSEAALRLLRYTFQYSLSLSPERGFAKLQFDIFQSQNGGDEERQR